MVVAGIVLYNPDIKRLTENIKGIKNQVDKLIMVDNNSKNIKQIEDNLKEYTDIKIIKNEENKGIAYALNQILNYAYDNSYDWFITLDQDSVAKPKLVKEYLKFSNLKDIAMMTCNIEDRNFNIEENEKDINSDQYTYITQCITSGSFNNTEILKKIGGFDEKMFIDSVDFDICATIIENNFKIIRIKYNGLLHEVGHAKVIKILGREEKVYNHTPFRTYYMIRNSLYFIKKHRPKNILRANLRILKRCCLILFYQDNKVKNLKAIINGYRDSKKM